MESRGQKFFLDQVQENDQIHLKLKNSIKEEIMTVIPKKEGKTRKMIMENNEKKTLYCVSLKNPSAFVLKIQKLDFKKDVLATLHTKVLDGNKFRLSIVEKEKYGSERFIEFSENGASFTITCDNRIVCEFQSNIGPVGTSGGLFKIASKEFRNFNLSVVSLVIIMQIDALKEGTKGVGMYFKDTGQIPPRSFMMKSSKGRDSSEVLSTPPSETAPPYPSDPIGNNKVRHSSPLLLEKATTSPVSPRKENPRKSRSGALSPEDPKRKLSTEKDTSSPSEKESSKKKGKNNKVAKNVEKPPPQSPPQSPRYLSPEGLVKSPITIPGGDSYVKCWDVLEAIVAQNNGNQT